MSTLIELKDVSFSYSKNRSNQIIKQLSLSVYKGETLTIVGESGAGKTTLGKLLIGLEKPTSGEVLVEGRRLDSKSSHRIQYVYQNPAASLNPKKKVGDSIAEPLVPLGVNKKDRYAKVLNVIKNVSIHQDLLASYPSHLSGGQIQRVCIARAIISEPSYIVFDEALSSVDMKNRFELLQLLKELKQLYDLTYIFVSHDLLSSKYLSDRIILLDKGCIEQELVKKHHWASI